MTVKEIVLIGDPRLRQAAIPVDFADNSWRVDAQDLADTLKSLRKKHGFGRALAGPQIGSSFRLIAFECDLGTFVAVNPIVTWKSGDIQPVWDDCFSLPGIAVGVMRHTCISFEYHDEAGAKRNIQNLTFRDSELVQHEVDHLNGVLMTDCIIDPKAIIASSLAEGIPVDKI